MAISVPAGVTAGTTITEAWGDSVGTAISYLANPPFVRVRKSAGQSITTGVDTLLTWDTEDKDSTGTMHSTSSNTGRLVAPDAGWYRFILQTDWDGNATGQRSCNVGKNRNGVAPGLGSSRVAAMTAHTRADVEVTLYGEVQLAAGDYIEAFVYQDSGGTRTFGAAQRVQAYFAMTFFSL